MGSTCSSSFKSDWLQLLDEYVLIGSGRQKTKENRLSISDSGLKFKMAFKQRYLKKSAKHSKIARSLYNAEQ